MNEELTPQKLAEYRIWLQELDAEAREAGDLNDCDEDIWDIFDPDGPIGEQVFRSYHDTDLLWLIAMHMKKNGQTVPEGAVYVIYRRYIERRFGSWRDAMSVLRPCFEKLRLRAEWPPDWPDRVSVEPVEEHLAKKGKQLSDDDLRFLESLCDQCRATRKPPYLSLTTRKRLRTFGDENHILRLLRIPNLSKNSLKDMQHYWSQARRYAAVQSCADKS